nr:cupin domain-containing protein [Ruegeria sp. HKCCD8929]
MLTRNDRTVADAEQHLETALAEGVHHIGFKDVGLPLNHLKKLNHSIKTGGATSYLEVVSLDRDSEIRSAKAAIEIGVDILMGGTHVEAVLPLLEGTGIRYYPFPGKVAGHPSVLEGSTEEIVASARQLASHEGVHGLDLLAYRSSGDIEALMSAVCQAIDKPVIMAGSICDKNRIATVRTAGAAGFTIGTAALDGAYPETETDLRSQLRAIMRDLAEVNNHVSDVPAKNLVASFAKFEETWSPRIAGRINDMLLKLVKLKGEFVWHYHTVEDELFFVHRGKMLMKFRDRDEVVNEGEFIIVPHGVEHCPVALSDICEVMLLEPGTTLNTGNATDERTVNELVQI